MHKKEAKIIKLAKRNLLLSLVSLLFLLIAFCSAVFIWHLHWPKGVVWVFVITFFGGIVTSTVISVRTIEKAIRILKIKKDINSYVALVVSVLVFLSIIVTIIKFYG